MYYAYVVWNKSKDKIYIGQTDDLDKRKKQHNDPNFDKKSYTKHNKGKWILVHSETFQTRQDAIKREKELKSSRGRSFIRTQILKKIKGP